MKSFLVELVVYDDAVFFFAIVWNQKEVNNTIVMVFPLQKHPSLELSLDRRDSYFT